MAESPEPWPQEIRLAVTMVGGASLAVWMGGVATETSQLLRESRGAVEAGAYRRLLDLLQVKVSIDVLTGTSAGGINAACLGLAEAFDSTPQVLRDTWIEIGSLDNLIRDPGEATPRSLLDGDRVLLGGLEQALHEIADPGKPPSADDPPDITVLLTGTMIDGETTRFDDALGNLVRDTEHRMLFRFDGPLWTKSVLGPLALAARSTASFPGAFELSRLPIGPDGTDRLHPDMTPYTDLTRSHWLTDGGVMLNKPLRPALREIFERPSHSDVRRLLLYVVPTGERETSEVLCEAENPPLLASAMSKVVSTVMSQTISTELEDLTRHNDAVLRARDTRVSLAELGLRGGPESLVDRRIATSYLERRTAEDAAELVRTAGRRYALSDVDTPDRQWVSGLSRQLRDVAVKGLSSGITTEPPAAKLPVERLVVYRTTALDDAVATGLQLINAGFRLVPDAGQAAGLNQSRGKLHEARKTAARGMRLAQWVSEHEQPGESSTLEDWVRQLAEEWAGLGRSDGLMRAWPEVVAALREAAPTLQELAAKPALPERQPSVDTVKTLLKWLELGAEVDDEVVQARLLSLHVATRGLLAQAPSVDQRVDLVQVSADSRTLLDMTRRRSWDKLTGMQANYFGAFYKASWRANDWMWGRVDGAGWLMQCLLDPKRLLLLKNLAAPGEFRSQLRDTFTAIGWHRPGAEDNLSASEAADLCDQLSKELAFLGLDADLHDVDLPAAKPPISMPVTAMVLARARQLVIAAEELPVVGEHCCKDFETAKGNGKPSAGFRTVIKTPLADPAAVQRAFQACQVSAEKFQNERGSMLLTKTLIKAGAAGLNAAVGAARMPKTVRPAAVFAQTTGRSAWWVTRGASQLGGPWNLVAAAITLLAGLVLGGNGGPVLQWVGLPIA
ncbi:MAG TPA: patatin-like protein, partial [Amycolatopsis sp.]|nr:patatin-like protein [Amycolatopsis sp.]